LAQFGGVGFGGQAGAGLQQEHGHKGPKAGELGHGLGRTWQWCCEILEGNRISGLAMPLGLVLEDACNAGDIFPSVNPRP
jgi:hypothetical protein